MEIGVEICFLGILPGVLGAPSAGIIVARPVDKGVIEVELYPVSFASFCHLADNVFFVRRRVHDVVIRIFRVEHREAVVVARGEADIPCP